MNERDYIAPDGRRELWLLVGRTLLGKVGADPDLMDVLNDSFAEGEMPYHGLRHCVGVACRAYDASRYVALGGEHDLALAGLFHDAGHRGQSPDSLNIEVSLDWWERAGGSRDDHVAQLIRSTCFPHEKSYSLPELLLRDADLLQCIVHPDMGARLAQESGVEPWMAEQLLPMLSTQWGREVAKGNRVVRDLVNEQTMLPFE